MKLNIPIEIVFDDVNSVIDELGKLQKYKLGEGDDMTLVNVDDVADVLTRHVMAREAKESCGIKEQWIPCSERLPEEKDAGILKKMGIEKRSEYVLATVEVKGERMTVTARTHDGKWDWNMKYAFPDFKVVAWMPLPEPWGGEIDG